MGTCGRAVRVFGAQPATSGRQVESGRDRREAKVRLPAASDDDLLSGRGAFHVPAEAVAELVGADHRRRVIWGVELGGLEPPGFRLPAGRSFQLSYSPKGVILGEV